jgi:hypothetical protein
MSIQSATCFLFALGALATLPFALTACELYDPNADSDNIVLDQPPPVNVQMDPPRAEPEVIPRINDPQAEIWRPGYWAMASGRFVWIPGKVINRPAPTAVWATAIWVHHTYGWAFQEGHWE